MEKLNQVVDAVMAWIGESKRNKMIAAFAAIVVLAMIVDSLSS